LIGHAVALEVRAALVSEWREEADLGVQMTVEVLEATFVRMVGLLRVTEVPLADHGRLVAGGLKALRHEVLVRMHANRVPRQGEVAGSHDEPARLEDDWSFDQSAGDDKP
jgi:hypothetical protein